MIPAEPEPPPEWPAVLRRRFGPVVRCHWLGAGTSRTTWYVETPDQRLVWRRPRRQRPPGSDSAREARVLEVLQGWPEVPELLWSDEQDQSVLTYVPGQPGSRVNWGRTGLRRQVLHVLDRLWAETGQAVSPWDYTALVETYARRAGSKESRRLAADLLRALADWPSQEPVLVHHDLQADNLVVDPRHDRLALLDWEYAAPGNPWLDAVTLAGWCPLSAAERAWLNDRLAAWRPRAGQDPFVFYGTWMRQLAELWALAGRQG